MHVVKGDLLNATYFFVFSFSSCCYVVLEPKGTSIAAENPVLSLVSPRHPQLVEFRECGTCSGCCLCWEDLALNRLLQCHLHTAGERGRSRCPLLGNHHKPPVHKGVKGKRVVVEARAGKGTLLWDLRSLTGSFSLTPHMGYPRAKKTGKFASLPVSLFLISIFLVLLFFLHGINSVVPFRL